MRAPRTMLSQLGHPRVLVVGDVMLDRYTWGDAERVSPEAPVLVLRVEECEVRLGGAASVARLLRGLEADVTLAGVIGDDASGRTIRRLLEESQIEGGLIAVDSTRPTTTKERLLGRAANRQAHQILRVDTESRTPLDENLAARMACDVAAMLSGEAPAMLGWPGQNEVMARSVETSGPSRWSDPATLSSSPVAAVLISDYAKGVCTPELVAAVIAVARSADVPVLVDPARGVDYERYRGATLLKPNRLEAELAVGHIIASADEALSVARQLREQYDCDAVVITLDKDGLVYVTSDEAAHVPITPREICDITGAGDIVLATLGLSLASGLPLAQATQLANLAAGVEVARPGVTPVSRDDLDRELARHTKVAVSLPETSAEPRKPPETGWPLTKEHRSVTKLVTLDEAARLANEHRRAGRTIVFTNGCFDLLHAGHVRCLNEASQCGDVLFVAINSDESVRKLKGPSRPIVGQHDRAEMLSALECIDHILIFDDDTPHRLLHALRPDILVKGGTTPEIIGQEIVQAYGGQVIRTAEVPDLSTTAVVTKLRSSSICQEAFS